MRTLANLLAVCALAVAAASAQSSGSSAAPQTAQANEASARAATRAIVTAEITYFSAFPTVGFTCALSDLGGPGNGGPNEHQAMLIKSDLAGGKKFGYLFTLSGCKGTPAISFRVVAVPELKGFGQRAFCADESGTVRYSTDGNAATCLANGIRAQ